MKTNSKARELLSLLQRLIRREVMLRAVPMEVVSVNKNNATIVVKQLDVPELHDVRLRASIDDGVMGVVVFPKVGSSVLIDYILNDSTSAYVTKMSEFESALITLGSSFKCELKSDGYLVLNDGNNGALVKISPLEQKIDTIAGNFNIIKNGVAAAVTAAAPAAPADGIAGFNALNAALNALQTVNSNGLNNDKIKH